MGDGFLFLDYLVLSPVSRAESCFTFFIRSVGVKQSMDHTAIELTGNEPATVMQVTDEKTGHKKCAYRFFQFWALKTDLEPN